MAEDQVPGSGCSELSSRPAVKERDYGKNIFFGCSSVHLRQARIFWGGAGGGAHPPRNDLHPP
jgi:hypothetical protein